MSREDLAARLRATFAAEVDEQVRVANGHLLALEASPTDAEAVRALFRVMHTLKGAARAAGVPELETLCHELESLLAELRDRGGNPTQEELARLFAGVDRLEADARALVGGGPTATWREAPGEALPQPMGAGGQRSAAAVAEAEAPARVRVTTGRIDDLVSLASRLVIAAGRTDEHPEALWRVYDCIVRASAQLRDASLRGSGLPETDEPLWQTLRSAAGQVESLAADAVSSGRELRTLAGQLSGGVRELRMRPFADAVEALPRLVRDLAVATGKEVRLEVLGEAVEADRAVLEEVREALLHVVRNAVDHGIEKPQERVRRGKPAHGTVRVTGELRSDRLFVTVQDDGTGLDADALRAALARAGRHAPEDEHELALAAFAGGISTRREAGVISGRGVGLNAALAAMQRVRGNLDAEWSPGAGATFTLDAPVTLAGLRAVLARVGPHLVAVPTAFVERLLRVRADDVQVVEGRECVLTGHGPVALSALADVLGEPFTAPPPDTLVRALLLHAGERRAFVAVDELLAEEEVLVRPIAGREGDAMPHLTGVALLPSGRVALVLNPATVVAAALGTARRTSLAAAPPGTAPSRRRILVVDDSLTTRALEESLLEAAGYEVRTAVDGAAAWAALQERGADLVLSDVEMPRMDGFALCEAMRASQRFRSVPVILVTALESAEHRARGLEVGADAYLPKSSFDQETLLETIQQLLG